MDFPGHSRCKKSSRYSQVFPDFPGVLATLNWAPTELFRNFIKHFQPMYKQGNRNRLFKHLKPVTTIFDPKFEDESDATSLMKAPVSNEEILKN